MLLVIRVGVVPSWWFEAVRFWSDTSLVESVPLDIILPVYLSELNESLILFLGYLGVEVPRFFIHGDSYVNSNIQRRGNNSCAIWHAASNC